MFLDSFWVCLKVKPTSTTSRPHCDGNVKASCPRSAHWKLHRLLPWRQWRLRTAPGAAGGAAGHGVRSAAGGAAEGAGAARGLKGGGICFLDEILLGAHEKVEGFNML